jgi:hypothetical protein
MQQGEWLLSLVSIDSAPLLTQHRQNSLNISSRRLSWCWWLGKAPMSLCWSSNADHEENLPLNVKLLLAVDEFLFEDVPRCADLLTMWAGSGALWFFWLLHLFSTGRRC